MFTTRTSKPIEGSLARAARPRNLGQLEGNDTFEAHPSDRVICIAHLRGICPNGKSCYLLHPPLENIVNSIYDLQKLGYLRVPKNVHWNQSSKQRTPYETPKGEAHREICTTFLKGHCQFGRRCIRQHFHPQYLRKLVEPESSTNVFPSQAGPSTSRLVPPEIVDEVHGSPSVVYSTMSPNPQKIDQPPSPIPIPSTYESSVSSSPSSSSSDYFHTPGNSPKPAPATAGPDGSSSEWLNLPTSSIPANMCRDFYRSGKCSYGSRCRYNHERPPDEVVRALAARTKSIAPPSTHSPPSASPLPAQSPSVSTGPSAPVSSRTEPANIAGPSLSAATRPIPSQHGDAPVRPHHSIPGHTASPVSLPTSSPILLRDVCPEWYRHGACKTHGCDFVHAMPESEPSLPARPLPENGSCVGEVLPVRAHVLSLMGNPLRKDEPGLQNSARQERPQARSQFALSTTTVPTQSPYTPGPRFSQQPLVSSASNDRRAPPGICNYWYNSRPCPHRSCTFRHAMLPNVPMNVPPATIPPSHSGPPRLPSTFGIGAGLHMSNAGELPRVNRPVPSIPSTHVSDSARSHTLLHMLSGGHRESAATSAIQSNTARSSHPAPSTSSVTSLNSSIHVSVSPSRTSAPTVPSSSAVPSAPPGLPLPAESATEEYSKDGLFTPEQALPKERLVSSTTNRFLRDNPSLPTSKSSRSTRPRGPSYPPDMQHVVNEHIKVTLGPGFAVQMVLTQNETRWLVIGNLPSATTKAALTHLIEGFGGVVSDMQMPELVAGEESISVRVQMSSHAEAVSVANGLDGMTALRSIGSLSVRPTLHRAAAKSQISDSDIRISWKLPTISLYAGFSSIKAAHKAVATADGYDWDGYWVTASIYDGFPVVGEHNVRFNGLPPDVKHGLVRQRFHCTRADLNTDKPSQVLRDFGIPQVETRVREFGRVVDFHAAPGPYKDGYVRAWCRFESSDVASVAHELNGIPQRSLNQVRLNVRRIHSLKYSIRRTVYDFIGGEVHSLREATWRFRRGCVVRIFDQDQWKDTVTVDISAEDNKSLQEIKARLVDIAQGEIILDGNVPLWDRFFATPFGTEWMNTIRKAHPTVLIIIRKLQSYIRVIGAPEKRKTVVAAVRDHVAALRGEPIHTIPLPGTQFGLFMHPALLAARKDHGAEKLWLDIQHRQLCIRGDEAMYKDVQAAVHAAIKAHPRHIAHNRCPVCFDIPTSPVVLSCGDTYCKDCLASYLAAGAETRQFPLTCFGADGKCKEPVPLVVARDVLPPAQWEQLIAAAFNAHIATKPNEFRFCPTPDCQQVYRPGAKDSVYSCPACLVRICPYCDVEYHEGITCDDRTHRIDSAFDEYVRTHEVKQCPGCKAPIERAEGCNHMTCTRCHTHTCWECMETFDKGVGIYDHMREAHGSIGV